jgi:hypothetical protein
MTYDTGKSCISGYMPDMEGLHIRHISHIGHDMYGPGPPTSLMLLMLAIRSEVSFQSSLQFCFKQLYRLLRTKIRSHIRFAKRI